MLYISLEAQMCTVWGGGKCRTEVYSVQKLVRYFIAVFGDYIKLRNPDEYYKALGGKRERKELLVPFNLFFLLCYPCTKWFLEN